MPEFVEKYINPFTDFGFKKLFGSEPNKGLLLDFLNELLKEEQGQITQLEYLKNEHLDQEEADAIRAYVVQQAWRGKGLAAQSTP